MTHETTPNSANVCTPPPDWLSEPIVIQRLGLSRAEAKNARAALASERPDWFARGEKGRVFWAPPAVQAMLDRLAEAAQKSAPELLADLTRATQAPEAPPPEELTVLRWQFPNHQVIECARANGQRVLVRVKASANFRPRLMTGEPMTLPARQDGHGTWWFCGTCPRWPGKW